MGLSLKIAELYVPAFVRKAELERLYKASADAFLVSAPSIKGLHFNDSMKLYARFTREQAERWTGWGETDAVKTRLFENAFKIGSEYRTRFSLRTEEQVMRASRVIYKILGIDFRGGPTGDIIIPRCFFSSYYSPDVCRLVSSLDEGLLAGLSGGSRLSFSERITEGHSCCRAHLEMETG